MAGHRITLQTSPAGSSGAAKSKPSITPHFQGLILDLQGDRRLRYPSYNAKLKVWVTDDDRFSVTGPDGGQIHVSHELMDQSRQLLATLQGENMAHGLTHPSPVNADDAVSKIDEALQAALPQTGPWPQIRQRILIFSRFLIRHTEGQEMARSRINYMDPVFHNRVVHALLAIIKKLPSDAVSPLRRKALVYALNYGTLTRYASSTLEDGPNRPFPTLSPTISPFMLEIHAEIPTKL